MSKKNKAVEETGEVKFENRKRRFGDRKDGYRIRDLDAMHMMTPYLLPDRTKNEAALTEVFDLTKVDEYLEKKNAGEPEFKYTFFHFVCAAMAKIVVFRPKMNYFIAGHRYYEHKELSFAFVVKRKFSIDGGEALAIINFDRDSDEPPIEQIYRKVKDFVYSVRKEDKIDDSMKGLDAFSHVPRFLLRFAVSFMNLLNYYGKVPESLRKIDPEYASVFISNLGSIKMSANYHHLADWGTNSLFVIINQKKMRPFFNPDGSYEMRDSLDMSFTIDERLADGFYFANSIKLLKKIFENPEIVERPLKEAIPEIQDGITLK